MEIVQVVPRAADTLHTAAVGIQLLVADGRTAGRALEGYIAAEKFAD